MTEKHHNPPLMVVGHLTLMFLFNVEGDGLLSIYTARVYVIRVQTLPFIFKPR